MSGQRDDMVIRPSYGPGLQPTVEVRERVERREQAITGKRGLLERVGKLAIKRRLLRKGSSIARGVSRRIIGEVASNVPTAARAGSAIATTTGAVAVVALVAAVATLRLASGQSFEGMGEKVNKMLIGDLDDEARAKLATKQQLQGNSAIARIVGQEGMVNAQIQDVGNELLRQNRAYEVGASALRAQFPVDNWLDILILRARDKLVQAWNGGGGPSKINSLRGILQKEAPPR